MKIGCCICATALLSIWLASAASAQPIDFTKWGSNGAGDGQFDSRRGIAVDDLGNVYVTDRDNDRVQKFDSSGNYITQWGSAGSGDGQFMRPRGIAVDGQVNVYVVDMDNWRIQQFRDEAAIPITSEIPTLGLAGLALLTLMLAGSAFWIFRRDPSARRSH